MPPCDSAIFASRRTKSTVRKLRALVAQAGGNVTPNEAAELLGINLDEWLAA